MLTPLLAKAFSLNQTLYDYEPYLKHPFVWNKDNCRFESRTKSETLPWLLCIVIVGGGFVIICAYLLLFGLYDPLIDKGINWLAAAITMVSCVFIVGANPQMFLHSNIGCTYMNAVLRYNMSKHQLQNVRFNGSLLSLLLKEHWLLVTDPHSCDIYGLLVFNITVLFHAVPYISITSGVIVSVYLNTNVDALYVALVALRINYNQLGWIIARPVIQFIYISEIWRTTLYDNIAALLVTSSLYKALRRIEKLTNHRVSRGINEYIQYYLLHESGDSFQRSVATWLLNIGYGAILIMGTAVSLGTKHLPLVVYGLCIVQLLVCVGVFMSVYPNVTASYNFSLSWVRKCKLAVIVSPLQSKLERRILLKKIGGLRPFCFYFGSFRKMDDDAKREFVDSLICRTADFLVFIKTK